MNKQELIERIENLPCFEGPIACTVTVNREWILQSIEQLDEPQKVTIPQFVAEYIEFKKKYDFHVYGAMREIEDHYDKRVQEWFYEGNIETFARAWIDGYEVEKEKRYLVSMKGVDSKTKYLYYGLGSKTWLFKRKLIDGFFRKSHTRKELEEAGFGEVFDSPLFEVEEVEE